MHRVFALGACIAIALSTGCASHRATSAAPTVEPRTQQFLDAVNSSGGPPLYTLSPTEARAVLSGAQAGPVDAPGADVEDRTIPFGPGSQTRIRIVRPQGDAGPLPVVMYFHGGGWMLGDAQTHDRLIREIATGANVAVVFVEYERTPEARFPIALDQCYAATKYIADHPGEFHVDGSRLAVAGDSAGGNLAAAVTMMAKQRGGPAIDFQVLFYPVTDANFHTGSYLAFAENHFLTRKAMIWFWNAYVPVVSERSNPLASPLQATIEELRGLPPALVITAEHDVLRDEGEAYAHKLAQAGVVVIGQRYLGTIHDFVMLNGVTSTPAARSAIATANAVLKAALAK